ncbi:MAG TPA: FeoA domain-containing protein, partial [Gemmatimonadales bacterium]|nr:FeoA domain-containing protein [Gemmatimonadales bacterium]
DTMVERMATALGHPEVDPHGDPIPSADGSIHELSCTRLSDIPVGETVVLHRVHESQPERLRYIASLGLKPGVEVTVIDRQPFDDLVTIAVGGRRHVIGRELGHVLQCVRRDEQ